LDEVGGFNEALMASEEPELAARLRHRRWEIWRIDAPMTEHDAAIFRFSQWWKRTTRSGYGYAQAWLSTRSLGKPINDAKLKSAMFWVGGAPAVVALVAIAARRPSLLIALPLVYALQIWRIALRREYLSLYGLRASAMLVLAKVPELIGAARAFLRPRGSRMIEYKALAVRDSGLIGE
jgi:hypothetical protein